MPARLPEEPTARPWLIAHRAPEGLQGSHAARFQASCSTVKITVQSKCPHASVLVINIIPYTKTAPAPPPLIDGTDLSLDEFVHARAERETAIAAAAEAAAVAPIETVVDSFDLKECRVFLRMNNHLNGYVFGGAGAECLHKSLAKGGPYLPLELTPCVFGKATDMPQEERDEEHTQSWLAEQKQRTTRTAVVRQMERIAKYIRRGFRFQGEPPAEAPPPSTPS